MSASASWLGQSSGSKWVPSDDRASTFTDREFKTSTAVVSESARLPVGGNRRTSVADFVDDMIAIDWRYSCQRVLAGARAGRAAAQLVTVGTGLLPAVPAAVPLRSARGAGEAAALLHGAPGAKGKLAFSVQVMQSMHLEVMPTSLTCSARHHVACELASFGVEVHGRTEGTARVPLGRRGRPGAVGLRDGRVGHVWYMQGRDGGDETGVCRRRRVRELAACTGSLRKRHRL